LKKLLSFNQSIPPETYFYSSRPKAENHLAPNSDKEKNHHCRIFKNLFLRLRKIYKHLFFLHVSPSEYSMYKAIQNKAGVGYMPWK